MDAVSYFYQLDTLRLFMGKSLQEVQEIIFETGLPRRYKLVGRQKGSVWRLIF